MTISATDRRTSVIGGAAVGQQVPFSFPVTLTSDITVYTRLTSSGAQSDPLTETTDYTVDISGASGGTVTLVAALAATYTAHVIGATPVTQALDLMHGGDFSAENVEKALDKLTKLVIELKERVDMSPVAPQTDDTTLTYAMSDSVARASKYLNADASGNLQWSALADATAISVGTFGETLVANDLDSGARSDLGLVIGTDVQAYDADLSTLAGLATTNGNFIVGNDAGTAWTVESGATALGSLGVGAYMRSLLDDTTSAEARATLEVDDIAPHDAVLTHDGDVLTHDGNVLTWEA